MLDILTLLLASPSSIPGSKLLAHYTFEPGEEIKWGGMGERKEWYSVITTDPGEVISGRGSLKCDTTRSSQVWHTFFVTDLRHLRLKRNKAYFVSFKYRVLARKGGDFHFFLRSPTARVFTDKGWHTWREGPGPVKEKTFLVLVGNYDDYQIRLEVSGRGAIVVDDFMVWEEEFDPERLAPPTLLCPDDGAVFSPEATQLIWTVSYPATDYEVQVSREPDFSRPLSFDAPVPGGLGGCGRRFKWRGKEVLTNILDRTGFFLPPDLEEGTWYWRVRVRGGKWSAVRKFTIVKGKRSKGLPIEISPQKPLFILSYYRDPPDGSISTCWKAVPDDLRCFTASGSGLAV